MDINQLLAAIEGLNTSEEVRNTGNRYSLLSPQKSDTASTPKENETTGQMKKAAMSSGNPWAIAAAIAIDEVAGMRADQDRRKRENLVADQNQVAANAATYNYLTNAINNIRRR